ncbi:MAG: hypothetical protein K2G51_12755 [Lachnospiraceae bacterium]|nr:hypothetical protein [Lachnospiraceae bacterium]
MAQRNTIIGKIASIRVNENNNWVLCDAVTGLNGGTKIFLTIADRFWSTKDQSMQTRFIPFQAFVSEGTTICKGQLIAADFIVNPYIDKDGYTSIAFDVINWDFSLGMGNSGTRIDLDRGMRVAGGQFNDNVGDDTGGSINDDMNNSVQEEDASDGFRNIPDEIDEELPFN